jgi:hypothetical protein
LKLNFEKDGDGEFFLIFFLCVLNFEEGACLLLFLEREVRVYVIEDCFREE